MRRRLLQSRRRKSQSAMEYLMTYGWAILIIAIVLAALFQLGVFSSASFAPKAPPGSCQVFRPNGPGTTSFISTEGECNGELPQYVASFSGSSDITLTSGVLIPVGNSARTVTFWLFVPTLQSYAGAFGYGEANSGQAFSVYINNGPDTCFDLWSSNYQCNNPGNLKLGVWEFAAGVYNATTSTLTGYTGYGGALSQFIASTNQVANTVSVSSSYPLTIGGRPSTPDIIGSISNVQLYNSTLSTNDITSLYQEGIGGAPIDLQNLVAWWPLNGNSNDYSGNNNNGVPNGVTYTSNWFSGYAAP